MNRMNRTTHLLDRLTDHYVSTSFAPLIPYLHPVNPLNTELNPICHLLALVGAHHIVHVSRIRVNYIHLCEQHR